MWPFKKDQKKSPKERDPVRDQVSPEKGVKNEDDEYEPAPYYARVIKELDHGKGYWNTLRVGIFRRARIKDFADEQIGEYARNYSSLMGTFYPFERNGQWYALYSKNYTATRVMTLPDCRDIGGEEAGSFGFCPVEYFVPQVHRCSVLDKKIDIRDWEFEHSFIYAPFGFVSGCIWGDDSSWKVQYLDLSQVEKGTIKRDDRFGYIELPHNVDLADAIGEITDWNEDEKQLSDCEHKYQFSIATAITYRMWPDGSIHVFGKDDIVESTRTYEGELIKKKGNNE